MKLQLDVTILSQMKKWLFQNFLKSKGYEVLEFRNL